MNLDYEFEIDVDKSIVKARAFTLGEYLDIIGKKESDDYTDTVISVLDNCLLGSTSILGYPKREAEYILLQIWAHSIGKINFDAEYTCCGKIFNVPMNMSRAIIDKPDYVKKKFDGFTIQFREPKIFDDADYIETFMDCIDYIIIDDNQFTVDELAEEDYQVIIDTITTRDVDELVERILKPTIRMGVPVKCPHCGNYKVEELVGLHDLLGVLK